MQETDDAAFVVYQAIGQVSVSSASGHINLYNGLSKTLVAFLNSTT